MAFETIVSGQIQNRQGNLPGVTVKLNAVLEQNPTTGYRNTSTVFTSTTDTDGRVQFSGVAAGTYDVQVVSGSSFYMYNYIVKNSYTVVEGGSEVVEESRTFVRSSETLAPSGIMVPNPYRYPSKLGVPQDDYVEASHTLGTISGTFYNPFDEAPFSVVSQTAREIDYYFRGNQNLKHSQNFTFKLP